MFFIKEDCKYVLQKRKIARTTGKVVKTTIKMKNSIIDLHLSSTHYADTRTYRLGHCQMVAWLINNFRKIKSGEVTYKDYEKEGNSNGIMIYNEESFNTFKEQQYV